MLQRPTLPASKIPHVVRRVARDAPGADRTEAAEDPPAWSLPKTVALVTAASAVLWLTIVELSRRLAGWLDAPSAF